MQNPFLFNNMKDDTLLPQVIPGGIGTRPKAGGAHEFNSFLFTLLQLDRLQLMTICCNRRGVYTVHLLRHLLSCTEHALIVVRHTAWLKNVLVRVMSSACVRLDRLFSLLVPHLVPFRVFLLSLLLLPEP